MKAEEFIKLAVSKKYQPFAKVIVSNGKNFTHTPLKPDDVIPPDDDKNTIFLRIEQLA